MKNRVLVDICGREFALITDESESYMMALAAEVNKMINDSAYKNLRTSRNDAALLICLDLCDRKNKLSAANDNMRAQITDYVEEIDRLKKQLELSEQQLAAKRQKANSEIDDKAEFENGDGGEEEYKGELQEQPENTDSDLQDEYVDADDMTIPNGSEQKEDYTAETENKTTSKPVQAKSKNSSSPSSPPYGSYLFGSGRNRVNSGNAILNENNDANTESGEDNKKREKDFESLKERFNRLQKSMSKP